MQPHHHCLANEDSTALLELLHLQQYKQAQGAICVVGHTCQHEAKHAMLSLLHSQLTELTTAGFKAGAAAALGAGAGASGWQSGQYMMASNCVSASQRTRESRESGPLKSDSHSGKGAPKGSSCTVVML